MLRVNKHFYKNKTIPLLFALGIFGFPLVASIPVILEVDSRPISILLRLLVLFLALLSLYPIRKDIITTKYFMLFALFWLMYIFRIAHTYMSTENIIPFMNNVEFVSFAFGTCLIPALAIFNRPYDQQWDTVLFYNITFFVLIIATTLNLYLSFKSYYLLESLSGRLKTDVLNPITLGQIGSSLVLLSMHSLFSKKRINWLGYIVLSISTIIGLVAVLSSGSKGPMLAFSIVLLIFLVFQIKPKNLILIVFFIIAGLGVFTQILDLLQEKFNINAFKRFEGVFDLLAGKEMADESTNIRVKFYADAWNQFLDNPFFGSGIVEKNSGFYPHNVFIESFMSIGVVGGIIFIMLSALMLQKSVYLIRIQHPLGWAGLLAIYYLVSNLFSGSIFSGYPFWLSLAFVFSINSVNNQFTLDE